MAVSTAALTLGLWFLFDRTRNGFLLGLASGVSGTIIVFKLVQLGIFEYFWIMQIFELIKDSIMVSVYFVFLVYFDWLFGQEY